MNEPATNQPNRTTFKRTRIVLQDGDYVRPMLALGLSADGGLMLDLSNCAPMEKCWTGALSRCPICRQNAAAWPNVVSRESERIEAAECLGAAVSASAA